MKKLKVVTVLGTRPEIIRLSVIIKKFDQFFDHTLVHTGQNYDFTLNEIFFEELCIRKPDFFLNVVGQNLGETMGNVLSKSFTLFNDVKPDALLVLGDTNSALCTISAKRLKIPIFHMEAGNRCYDQNVPEELNRKIADHTADINLTYSSIAREYLLREGLPSDMIIKTGSPTFEVLNHYRGKIDSSDILSKLDLKSGEYFLVSAHREENIDSDLNFGNLVDTLNSIAKSYDLPIIVSTHPRTQKKIDAFGSTFNQNIRLLKPLGFTDYNMLQLMAKTTLSDSGTINEESSIMNFPALNIREAHERPEGMEEAAVMMVGLESERVMQGLKILENQSFGDARLLNQVQDYSMPNVSEKVVRIIHSYVDYVNRTVWKKY